MVSGRQTFDNNIVLPVGDLNRTVYRNRVGVLLECFNLGKRRIEVSVEIAFHNYILGLNERREDIIEARCLFKALECTGILEVIHVRAVAYLDILVDKAFLIVVVHTLVVFRNINADFGEVPCCAFGSCEYCPDVV